MLVFQCGRNCIGWSDKSLSSRLFLTAAVNFSASLDVLDLRSGAEAAKILSPEIKSLTGEPEDLKSNQVKLLTLGASETLNGRLDVALESI